MARNLATQHAQVVKGPTSGSVLIINSGRWMAFCLPRHNSTKPVRNSIRACWPADCTQTVARPNSPEQAGKNGRPLRLRWLRQLCIGTASCSGVTRITRVTPQLKAVRAALPKHAQRTFPLTWHLGASAVQMIQDSGGTNADR